MNIRYRKKEKKGKMCFIVFCSSISSNCEICSIFGDPLYTYKYACLLRVIKNSFSA